jgi:hypothetical protein
MKTFFLTTMVAVFLLLCTNGIQAQTTQTKLDQVELMKKFIGTWKTEMGKDTTMILNFTHFGTALEGNFKIVTKGKILNEAKKLIGYDKTTDKLIETQIMNNSPDIFLVAFCFTSENKSEAVLFQDISNPENATFKWEEEFKSPDMFIQSYIENNKVVSVSTFTREKR